MLLNCYNYIGDSMNKKVALLLVFFIGSMFLMYMFTMNNSSINNEEIEFDETSNKENNKEEQKEKKLIGEVNDIKLYVTDYQYDSNINGYHYQLLSLTDEQINYLKEELKNVDLYSTARGVVYGQYELVLDGKKIFYDINNDYALYLDENKTFKLSQDIKNMISPVKNNCSCCTTENCKIKLCKCLN